LWKLHLFAFKKRYLNTVVFLGVIQTINSFVVAGTNVKKPVNKFTGFYLPCFGSFLELNSFGVYEESVNPKSLSIIN